MSWNNKNTYPNIRMESESRFSINVRCETFSRMLSDHPVAMFE